MKYMTACTMDCPDACAMVVAVSPQGAVTLSGNPDHPVTKGFVCAKIKKHPQRLASPHRITFPMIKQQGRWQKISWPDALDLCAEKINALRSRPSAILHCHGEGAKGVLKQLNKLFFAKLGATRTKGSLCDAAGFVAGLMDFGSRHNNDILDILNARAIVNWGKDFSSSSIHTAALVKGARSRGAGYTAISPVSPDSPRPGETHIRIKPGTDRFLAAAVIKLLAAEEQISSSVLSAVQNWPAFKKAIDPIPVSRLAEACQISRKDIEKLAAIYMSEVPVATFIGAGLQRYRFGGENVRFINALAMLSGNVGKSGGGVYFHLHSLANLNTDWTSKGPLFKNRRALPVATLGSSILEAENPEIDMIWINGSNVVNQAPDSLTTVKAFEQIPFKVVVDAFMTDTASHADLFLPATLMLEQEDLVGSYLHHYITYAPQVLPPPGEARSDDWILYELGRRLDPPIVLPDKDTCFEKALQTPDLDISLSEIRQSHFVKASRPQVVYEDLEFDHPDGKYRLPQQLHPEPEPPEDYPLILLSLIRRSAMHSQILPEEQDLPVEVAVSPRSPALKKLDLSKEIWLTSKLGALKVRVRLSETVHPNAAVARRGTWIQTGGGLNQMVAPNLTDIGKGAAFYATHVRLENRPPAQEAKKENIRIT